MKKSINKENIDVELFAKSLAKVILDLKSSHCYFIMQMAFGEDKSWEDVEKICNEIIKKDISCPFCKEDDFDLRGLKHHLLYCCEPFESTERIK